MQLDLENKLHNVEMKMELSLERSLVLEKDLVRVKEQLEKSVKWTSSSKIHINPFSQVNDIRRGIGCEKIDSPYNS